MANHVIPENPQISLELQKLRTTDRAHADIFNNINAKLIENDAYLEKEIRKVAKEGIQLTTDRELVNSLINNTAKAGSVLLFSNIGERYGNVTDESYTLYAGLMNCNRYSGCDITVKAINMEEQSLHPMFFQSPNFFIAKVDKQNAKRVVIYPLGGGNVEELRERLDGVEEKANQAFTQAHEGKQLLADALVSKQQIVSSSASFGTMAKKIRDIKVGDYKSGEKIENGNYTIYPQTKTSLTVSFDGYSTGSYHIYSRGSDFIQAWTTETRKDDGYTYNNLHYKSISAGGYTTTISSKFKNPSSSDNYGPGVSMDFFNNKFYAVSSKYSLAHLCVYDIYKKGHEIDVSQPWSYSNNAYCYAKINAINLVFDSVRSDVYSLINDQIVKTGSYTFDKQPDDSVLFWFGKHIVIQRYNKGNRKYSMHIYDASNGTLVFSSLEGNSINAYIYKSFVGLLVYQVSNRGTYTIDISTLEHNQISTSSSLSLRSPSHTDSIVFSNTSESSERTAMIYIPKTWRDSNWISVQDMFGSSYWDGSFWNGSGNIHHCLSENEVGYFSMQQYNSATYRYHGYKGTICEYMTLKQRG